jgi:hypothetical protein
MQPPAVPTPMEQELLKREEPTPDQEVDPAITRALLLLRDEEKPTVPVRMVDPDPVKYPIFRIRPNATGLTDERNKQILINRKTATNDELLASFLAHEQEHVKRWGTPDVWNESGPYQREYDVLSRLKYKDRDYMRALEARAKDRREAKDRK